MEKKKGENQLNLSKQVSCEQLRLMKHMLGLDYKKKPYRNYGYFHSIQSDLEDLKKKNLAYSHEASNGRDIVYHLTKEGVEFVLGREITDEEYMDI